MAALHASGIEGYLAGSGFDGDVFPEESLARHTSYRIGGPARYYVQANSISAVLGLIDACMIYEVPWVIIGRGSNLLVADAGFDGVVITLGRDFRSLRFDEERNVLVAGAGVMLSQVAREALHRSLGGLEFAIDVPGTVGGALRMNAGTHEDCIGNHVASVTVMRVPDDIEDGHFAHMEKLRANELAWDYRTSSFLPDDIIAECELSVTPSDPFFIRAKMEALHSRRKATQPLNFPSCGSVFRNPQGQSAAALIESVGMKGQFEGGAQVSPVHANFIVNTGGATAHDVIGLMKRVQAKVYEAHGIELQPEVRFLGFAQNLS